MKIGVIYARYSSDKQTEQSIEGQVRVCKEYAQENGITIANIYIDRAVSGKTDNRDGFQRMIRDSNLKLWDCVIVYKLDRFSRNKYETEVYKHKLKENNINLISAMEKIPDGPEGTLLESLIVGMNQYYSEELAQKSLRGLRETRLKGYFLGRVAPYGYYGKNRKLKIKKAEASTVQFIFTQYLKGFSARKIAKMLSEKHITKRGTPFANWSINRILHKQYYTGKITAHNMVFDNIYPKIIDENLFCEVQKLLQKNNIHKPGISVFHPLRHKIFCGICGKPYTTHSTNTKVGEMLRYYRCRGKDEKQKCTSKALKKELIEGFVFDALCKALAPSKITSIAEKITQTHNKAVTENSKKMSPENFNTQASTEIIKLEPLSALNKQEVVDFFSSSMEQPPQFAIELLVKKIVIFEHNINIFLHFLSQENFEILNKKIISFVIMKKYTKYLGNNHYSQKIFKRIVNIFI